jgi:rSAM/selenodomain-associated transferase 1
MQAAAGPVASRMSACPRDHLRSSLGKPRRMAHNYFDVAIALGVLAWRTGQRACKRVRMSGTKIIIFAKAPQPGLAKTRLIPALGAERAAALARHMLEVALVHALDARVGPVELWVTPAISDPAWFGVPIPDSVEISAQGEGDLGARLARATQSGLERNAAVMLIGSDCPELDSTALRQAAQILRRVDAVMHPTADGGYALLGLRRFHPRLFSDIAWSTSTVAHKTIQHVVALQWSLHVAAMFNDIDEPADLRNLPVEWLSLVAP